MAWHRVMLVAAAAAAVLAGDTHAQACPDGQFSVSVLDNPQVQCLASRPCSGVYGPQGLVMGVGACPGGTGCALLPHNPTVMGCVVAGRGDVSYVNPDGSLTRGGVVISGPPTTTTDANSNSNTNSNTNTNTNTNANAGSSTAPSTTTAPGATPGTNTETSTANSTATVTTSPTPTTNVPTPAHVKPDDAAGTSDDGSASKAPTATPAASSGKPSTETTTGSGSGVTESSVGTPSPTTAVSTPQANQQNALDDISGDIASKSGKQAGNAVGLGSIIAIVVGCLAVVAVIAGVFVLRKKKEQSAQTPVGGAGDVDNYGAACVTPKENVLLL